MKRIFLILSPLLIFIVACSAQQVQDGLGARTDNDWNLRGGSYLETADAGGYNILINGTNKYVNFNALSGSSGYGFRDNAGTVEYKSSGGSWAAVGSGGGGSGGSGVGWASSTDDLLIYNDDGLDTNPYTVLIQSTGVTATTTDGKIFEVIGNTEMGQASTTMLTVSGNSYLNTITTGTWNGTAIGDAYISSADTWNNKWDLASTTIGYAYGGTGLTTATDDNLMVGNGSAWQSKALPSCSTAATSKLLYDTATNAFSCGTDQTGGGGGDGTQVFTEAYSVTLADVDNSSASTTVLSATIGANDINDGDVIDIRVTGLAKSNTGGAPRVWIDVAYGGTASTTIVADRIWSNDTPEYSLMYGVRIMRVGSDLWVMDLNTTTDADMHLDGGIEQNVQAKGSNIVKIVNPGFTTEKILALEYKFDTANANLYFKPQSGLVRRTTATAIGTSGVFSNWQFSGSDALTPTSTVGVILSASSTISTLNTTNASTTQFTASDLSWFNNDLEIYDGAGDSPKLVLTDQDASYFNLYQQTNQTLFIGGDSFHFQPQGDTNDYFIMQTVSNQPSFYANGAYLRIGTTNTTGHGLSGVGDVLITSDLEVDGTAFLDNGASTTQFTVSAETWLDGDTTLADATTTSFAITNLVSCDTIDTTADGVLKCGTDATGAGGDFAWTPDTTYSENANSTTTPIWLKDSLYASSTSFFTGQATFAAQTNLQGFVELSDNLYFATVGGDIRNIDTMDIFPKNQATIGLRIDSDPSDLFISGLGVDHMVFQDRIETANATSTLFTFTTGWGTDLTLAGNLGAATYGSDSSVSDAELLYINTLSSNAQTQFSNILDGTTAFTDFNGNDIIDTDNLNWGGFTDLGEGGTVDWSNLASGELTSEVLLIGTDVKAGTLTDTKLCTWDSGNSQIVCNSTDQQGSGAFAWDVLTTYSEETSATSSPMWFQDTIYASSTSFFTGLITAVGGVSGDVTGALTGNADTCTTASAGDAAVDFFGAGVDAVTDATECTDIEGTGLSIGAGTLNWSSTGLTWAGNAIGNTVGGTGQDSSGWTGPISVAGGTWEASSTLSVAYIEDGYLLNTGDVGTGVYDFGGATSFEIPNAADPTVSATGQIAVDTTSASSSIRFYDGSEEKSLFASRDKNLILASSTLAYIGNFGASASTTMIIANPYRPTTLNNIYCKTDVGTAWVGFGDGTASTTQVQCTTTGAEVTPASNNTWTMRENMYVEVGTSASNPNLITITTNITEDAD